MGLDIDNITEWIRSVPLAGLRLFYGNRMRVRAHGHPFIIDLRDRVVCSTILVTGKWEESIARFLQSTIQPGDYIIDVGAHVGYFATLCARLTGETGRVLAIEPDPDNAETLRQNVRLSGLETTLVPLEAGAGAQSGVLRLFRNLANRGDHHMYDSEFDRANHVREAVEVSIVRIDDVVKDWKPVDIIKMDIQGYEPFALSGMLQTLANSPNVVFLSEFWPAGIRRAGSDPGEYLRTLSALDFCIYELQRGGELELQDAGDLVKRFRDKDRLFTDIVCARQGNPRIAHAMSQDKA